MRNHGLREPCLGVKIGDMQPLRKRIGSDYQLALELYDSENYDAMYFAGLIADDGRMTKRDLQRWVANAYGGCLPGTTVASVAAGGRYGWEKAQQWIASPKTHIAEAGWSTLSCLVALKEDEALDLPALDGWIRRVEETIFQEPDRVRYAMNQFVISVGCYVAALTDRALGAGESIGKVEADLGSNQCKIPAALEYIRKVQQRGTIGKKRKSLKC